MDFSKACDAVRSDILMEMTGDDKEPEIHVLAAEMGCARDIKQILKQWQTHSRTSCFSPCDHACQLYAIRC